MGNDDRWRLGTEVVSRLLPHGPGMRMVDGLASWAREPTVRAQSYKHIAASDPVFRDHFPTLKLWPGVYTIEGMAQSVILALALRDLIADVEAAGETEQLAADALRAVDDIAAMRPTAHAEALARLEALLGERPVRLGMLAGVQSKLLKPVVPGVRLDYSVELLHDRGGTYQAQVEASVDGVLVATGRLTTMDAPS